MTPEEKARIKELVADIRRQVSEMGNKLIALAKSVERLEAERDRLKRDAAHMRAILKDVAEVGRNGCGDMSVFDRAERWSRTLPK